jgi:hypothetical protein
MADALSRLPDQTKHVGVLDQTCDAHFFTLQLEWLHRVYEYLLKGVMLKRLHHPKDNIYPKDNI